MILAFLVVLVFVLFIANLLISTSRSRKTEERGFSNPSLHYVEAEVVEPTEDIQVPAVQAADAEQVALLNGAVRANNKKIEILAQRISIMEKVVAQLVEQKLSSPVDAE